MLSAILKIIAWVTGLFGPKSDPTQVQLADSNARAQEQLTQAENTNANLEKSASAVSAADAGIVRAVASQVADNDPGINAALKQQFPGQFRD